MPKSSRSSFPVSIVEWIASLYMAALPVTSAAPNLQIAIATLPAIAAMMTWSEPECSAPLPLPPTAITEYAVVLTADSILARSTPPTPEADGLEPRLCRRQPLHLAAGREAAGGSGKWAGGLALPDTVCTTWGVKD